MTPYEPDRATIQRRTVLKHVGTVGVSVVGLTGATGASSHTCNFEFEVGDCVATTVDAVVYADECREDPIGGVPIGERGVILERVCCRRADPAETYYVRWCDDGLTEGWVSQDVLEPATGCCDGDDCWFRWDLEACVETTGYQIPVYEEACRETVGAWIPSGSKGYVVRRVCCEEDDYTEMYLIEWCNPEIAPGWVRQDDLTESAGCCGVCEFKWDVETCVAAAAEETPIFEEPCIQEPFELIPEGTEGFIFEWICCEDGDFTEMYLIEWCDPNLPPSWVRQADLELASGCCEEW